MERFDNLYKDMSDSLEKDFDLKSELDTEYKAAGVNNVAVRIGGGISTNAFTIRISSELAVWDPHYIAVCKDMADVLNASVGNSEKATDIAKLKQKGSGYLDVTK